METYRKLFEFADGVTLERLLEREPDFPYDEEIVQTLATRTDLANCDALLNAFAKKKEGIEEQLDYMDFQVTCERDDNKQPTVFYLEYFKKFSGYYTRQRYNLGDINAHMVQTSQLPPQQLFVRAIEESSYELTCYDRLSDYRAELLTAADAKLLFSRKLCNSDKVIDCGIYQFYYIDPNCASNYIPFQKPYTVGDITFNFLNRKLKRNSTYPDVYYQSTSGCYTKDVEKFLRSKGMVVEDNWCYLSFYLRKLLIAKLPK